MKEYCTQAFTDLKSPCDLFIVGIDLDKPDHTDELENHEKRCQELREQLGKLHKQFKDKIIFFVPIQAVDYWLAYQQVRTIPNSLESQSKEDIKRKVYGEKSPNRPTIEKIAKSIAEKADFHELAKQSKSFAHFHKQITTFLDGMTKL